MLRMIVIACVASVCLGQQVADKDAKILKEQRFNAGDGRTGSAFATENGHTFREETDVNGNRIGQYSYIGDDGKVYTVKYSAGIDGFKILEGDHIQATGQDSAPFDPEIAGEDAPADPAPAPAPRRVAPAPAPRARVPLPARAPAPVRQQVQEQPRNPFINPHDPTHRDFAFNSNGAQFQPVQPVQAAQPARVAPAPAPRARVPLPARAPAPVRQQVQEQPRNPFINPHDPTHRDFAFNSNGAQFQPVQPVQAAQPARAAQQTPVTLDASFVPNCAGCEGLNPFVNTFDASHGGQLAGVQTGSFQIPRRAQPAPRPFVPQPVAPVQPVVQQDFDGQIKINRFETGFNFDFQA